MAKSQGETRLAEKWRLFLRSQRGKEMQLSQNIMAVLKQSVAVARDSVAVAKDSITMAKKSRKKDSEMQRQLMDAILSQNAFLQNMLLLHQWALTTCNLGSTFVLQPLNYTGYWDQQQLLPAIPLQLLPADIAASEPIFGHREHWHLGTQLF